MRVLLAAYDFPPIPSPQSLRWAYLVRELARLGHEVHVLAPDVPGYGAGGLPEIPGGVAIHRVYPGPFSALLRARMRKFAASAITTDVIGAASANVAGGSMSIAWSMAPPVSGYGSAIDHGDGGSGFHESTPNGRVSHGIKSFVHKAKPALVELCKKFLSYFIFPDYRAEWLPWAHRRLKFILAELRPDIVITSHEPACSLPLGLRAKQLGYRWVADLGDPILAPYTPSRWKKRAHALEHAVCAHADIITVTSRAAADILQARHGLPEDRCLLLTQGFDAAFQMGPVQASNSACSFDPRKLELLYTGSFYEFRRVGHLLRAVLDTPNVRLNVATISAPPELLRMAESNPESIRMLGFLSHREALMLQRTCDVLVNLANDNPVQVPGKLYEYLGAGTPILHIGGKKEDVAASLLESTRVGVCVGDDYVAILICLQEWLAQKSTNGHVHFDRNTANDLSPYSWQALAEKFAEVVARQSLA